MKKQVTYKLPTSLTHATPLYNRNVWVAPIDEKMKKPLGYFHLKIG